MTDRDVLIAMLDRFGVGWEAADPTHWRNTTETDQLVVLKVGLAKTDGYSGFVTAWVFSDAGDFRQVLIAE